MPKGPKGEKRHADTVQNAMLIGRIATGEVEDTPSKAPNRAKGGKIGGASRAAKLTPEQRKEISVKALKARRNQS
ncbi:MAG: RNA-binding protein [Bradyrhizobium sp.]|uniref:RNA-binding protein n=1 Tax=Bradyrhizobium sp. TaxID=376 RepID=UPI0025BDD290|nr:RNA-binding protein [Bradyrhizobium sp.]MBI5261633.1 RNA-binding protein [Bradyrhizobium sp.]